MREEERACALERRQRQHAVEQVRLFSGDPGASLRGEGLCPTKMAEAALAILEDAQEAAHQAVARALRLDSSADPTVADEASQPRTALGVVMSDTRVDSTVPGSPASTCGLIERLDEVLMVDGQRVTGDSIMAALRGNDALGAVVSILLRRASSGEVYTVQLPRVEVASVRQRQELNQALNALQSEALVAAKGGDFAVLADRLARIGEHVEQLDRLLLGVQLRLSAQVGALREGLEDTVTKGKAVVLDVDATHQQIHMLQALTEAELRDHLAANPQELDGAPPPHTLPEAALHKQIHELEGDLKALQEELSATQMLRREALDQAESFRAKVPHPHSHPTSQGL